MDDKETGEGLEKINTFLRDVAMTNSLFLAKRLG